MDLVSDLSPQVSRGFFRARDFVAFFWSPACFAWAIFLGLESWLEDRIRAVSGPYQSRIRAVSGPYIRAVSGPYQLTLVLQLGQSSCDNVAPNGSRGLSDPKSQNQRNLSGYKCTYNLAKTKKRQSREERSRDS